MTGAPPRVFSIPPGAPFLPTLARSLVEGRLVPNFPGDTGPLALADATIYLPTRRAARELRGAFVEQLGGRAAILPTIRPLGEVDEGEEILSDVEGTGFDIAPAVASMERVLLLAPLVQAWKRRLPSYVAERIGEQVVVPASAADAVWLARDLAALIDEVETEGVGWAGLTNLVPAELASWWQVTLDFLNIVTKHWPAHLEAARLLDPAAHRNLTLRAEAQRLARGGATGPVIAAGSTGSIPATADLLAVISRLQNGAVVLPGLDAGLDEESWKAIGRRDGSAASFGHPQVALKKLLARLGVARGEVGVLGEPAPALVARAALVNDALRPAETTDCWPLSQAARREAMDKGALAGVTLVEAANEREEAMAIAVALRLAIEEPGRRAALVTGDRDLARRVCAELQRFGIAADDSGGTPLATTPPAALLQSLVEAAFAPGDPLTLHALVGHPLLMLGLPRAEVRRGAETIELVALRGGTGRPDIAGLRSDFEARVTLYRESYRKPFWWLRIDEERLAEARRVLIALEAAVAPLLALRREAEVTVPEVARASVEALEAAVMSPEEGLAGFYGGDAGEALAGLLRELVSSPATLSFRPEEWPRVLAALAAGGMVKPAPRGDGRVAIWGVLEARLQSVDTMVLSGLNEGSWPRRAEADRFMSRLMKSGLELEPPERRVGQAAHDFLMAMGAERVVLTRSARSGDAPASRSRWLQRLLACVDGDAAAAMIGRGADLLSWARSLDRRPHVGYAPRPEPKPPVGMRPRAFSVTEIETLRRDPYAIYARHVLKLEPLEPLLRDPGAAERGNLFHDILHAYASAGIDPTAPDALERFTAIARAQFDAAALPTDVDAVWWPRFTRMAGAFIEWDRTRAPGITHRLAEVTAARTAIGLSEVTLRGRADRIDLRPGGMADILDFKTGSSPTRAQAHTLLAPQLALEAALLARGAFADLGRLTPSELAYVRLRANGLVEEESILEYKKEQRSAVEMADDAWQRLERLIAHYEKPEAGYLSRALPLRESDTSGSYDHLARVLEWSAGVDSGGDAE